MLKKKYTKLMKLLLSYENWNIKIATIKLASRENQRKNIIKQVVSKISTYISMHVVKCNKIEIKLFEKSKK